MEGTGGTEGVPLRVWRDDASGDPSGGRVNPATGLPKPAVDDDTTAPVAAPVAAVEVSLVRSGLANVAQAARLLRVGVGGFIMGLHFVCLCFLVLCNLKVAHKIPVLSTYLMLPTEEVSVSVMLVVTLSYCGGWCVVCVCSLVACAGSTTRRK